MKDFCGTVDVSVNNAGFMYAKQGIQCNAVAPEGVETNIDQYVWDGACSTGTCH